MIIQNFLGMGGVIQSINLAEQRERQRIAQVLHDDLQQLLYAALMQLPLASSDGAADPSIEVPRQSVHDLLQAALEGIRTLAVDLSPPVLQAEGLVAALQCLAGQMQHMHHLDVKLDVLTEVPWITLSYGICSSRLCTSCYSTL
jgi:signal transduction histidine kinase